VPCFSLAWLGASAHNVPLYSNPVDRLCIAARVPYTSVLSPVGPGGPIYQLATRVSARHSASLRLCWLAWSLLLCPTHNLCIWQSPTLAQILGCTVGPCTKCRAQRFV